MSRIDFSATGNNENLKPVFYQDKCDKYDYLIAIGCGAIAGMVDIFLVGSPLDSQLQSWTDVQVDKTVMHFAKTCEWKPRAGKENNVASAIGFLEKKFRVNYDQRHSADVGGLFNMSTRNHHMKSLAHSPDIVGLFFSILNQFTSTTSFLHDGKLISIQTKTFELEGHDFVSKLYCGVSNWFGHIMSDVAGSSGASGRGSGVVIPFYELFQLCDLGGFKVEENRNTLATVATKVFQEGYDVRFGLTMAIPVVLCELSIKLIWALKHLFYHKETLADCIPKKRHDDLRIMLVMGDGMLCLMDGADAAIRSGGNWVAFFLRLNIIAWYRLAFLVLREVCIRMGISFPLQKHLDGYIRINEALSLYLSQLEQIDIDLYMKETEQYTILLTMMEHTNSETDLNTLLRNEYQAAGIQLPFSGSFDEFMKDSISVLEFK